MPHARRRSPAPACLSLVLLVLAASLVGPPAEAARPKHRHKGSVTWDATTYGQGGAVVVHGRLPAPGKRKVTLQVKLPGGWESFGATRSDKKGRFAISAVLDWYGAHKVRVGTSGKRGFHRSTTATGVAAYAPRGSTADHVFNTSSSDTRLRFAPNPCRTVRYLVNYADVGPAGLAMVQEAMAQAEFATGVRTKLVGTTDLLPMHTPKKRTLPRRADLLVGWGTEAEIPELVQEQAVGITSVQHAVYARDGRGRRLAETRVAHIALDTDLWFGGNYAQSFFGDRRTFGKTVLHEIGHYFGLDHPTATDEVMVGGLNAPYPDGTYGGRYEAGDLTGLGLSMLGSGCHQPVRGRSMMTPPSLPSVS